MRCMRAHLLGMLVVLTVLVSPALAYAKGVPLIYNTGQEVFATGPLPPPYDQVEELKGYQAGYMCDIKGVMWSYFSVTNCKAVAFKDDQYTDEPELVKAITAKYNESDMQRGIWGHFGWMGMALLVLAGAALWLKSKISGDDEEAETASEG